MALARRVRQGLNLEESVVSPHGLMDCLGLGQSRGREVEGISRNVCGAGLGLPGAAGEEDRGPSRAASGESDWRSRTSAKEARRRRGEHPAGTSGAGRDVLVALLTA